MVQENDFLDDLKQEKIGRLKRKGATREVGRGRARRERKGELGGEKSRTRRKPAKLSPLGGGGGGDVDDIHAETPAGGTFRQEGAI